MNIETSLIRAPSDSRLNKVLNNQPARRCAIKRPYSCGQFQPDTKNLAIGLCGMTEAICYFAAVREAKLLL